MMNLKDTYNKIAQDWMQDHPGDTWWIEGVDKFLSFLPASGSILDVGCGPGQKSKYLINKGFSITGIDFSEKMIQLAKEYAPEAKFFVRNIKEHLNFEESFDGVFAQAVLLHIPKKEVKKVMENIIQPLNSGGYFYLAVKELRINNPEEEIVKENDYGYDYERFFSYFRLEELKDILLELGLNVIYEKVAPSGDTRWIQIIAKK